MSYPVTKSALLLVSAATFFYGMKPPTPPVEKQKVVYKGQFFEHAVRGITYLWQAVFCSSALAHAGVLLAPLLPSRASTLATHALCHSAAPSPALATLPAPFLLAAALLVAGGALRLWCYATLGRHFTFEITLLPGHALVTRGPYARARHPSYTGGCAMIAGTTLMFFGADGWVSGCGMRGTPFVVFVWLWTGLAPYAAWALVRRVDVEDAQLRKEFGAKWEEYRVAVPWKFVPYVF
ncbi:isoprenylcysteine carboxylmethyltransferase family protein [Phanerochaete sordida]|uniref:Protein-S-isoprenylcysteine O-methyltransferase n=1 Tax=Phanerochaete sordida TaxID=48140 RepID=A0A9P3LLM2_9APHY|nr:isoprenylcysteine carboxylmethyltransferase family protein [Phanerochaete sordida]